MARSQGGQGPAAARGRGTLPREPWEGAWTPWCRTSDPQKGERKASRFQPPNVGLFGVAAPGVRGQLAAMSRPFQQAGPAGSSWTQRLGLSGSPPYGWLKVARLPHPAGPSPSLDLPSLLNHPSGPEVRNTRQRPGLHPGGLHRIFLGRRPSGLASGPRGA